MARLLGYEVREQFLRQTGVALGAATRAWLNTGIGCSEWCIEVRAADPRDDTWIRTGRERQN